MKMNTKKLVLNSILLAIGLLLHQITPSIGTIQPDMALMMLFIIMILNKGDYKTSLVAGILTGIFTALTTKFPAGQVPNLLDKVITTNLIYFIMQLIYKMPIKSKSSKNKDLMVVSIILPLGTLISGAIFLTSASVLVGLPGELITLFAVAVVPATVINLVGGLFLFKIVSMSTSRIRYN